MQEKARKIVGVTIMEVKPDKVKLLDLLEAFRVHMCTQNHAMEYCVRDGQCPMAYPARFTVEGNEIRTINYCMIETVKAAMSKSMVWLGIIIYAVIFATAFVTMLIMILR